MKKSDLTENKKTIYFKTDGKAFQNGIDINTTASVLRDFQTIIDRSYSTLIDENQIKPKDRPHYRLAARSFEEGSFSSIADIFFEVVVPVMVHFGPEKIWEYAKTAFELLQYIYSKLQDDNESKSSPITINGDGNTIIINQGTTNYDVEKPVFYLAQQMRPTYRSISQFVISNKLEYFQIGSDPEKPEIRIDETNAKLFTRPHKILTNPVKAECEILSYNKKTGNGRLRVLRSPEIPNGEYSFSVFKQERAGFFRSLSEEKVTIICQGEILVDPFEEQNSRIQKLCCVSLL